MKNDARVRYTIKVCKEALLKLLEEKPINKITVKEVCDEAGINRATFYSHFSDCFDLLESIENDLLSDFEESFKYINSFDVTDLISAIYDMIDRNETVFRTLVFKSTNPAIIRRMIDAAHDRSIAYWRTKLKKATESDLEMLYTHLSHGLMHVVAEGYCRYPKSDVIRFVNSMVQCSAGAFE
ncbi:MAG: TetR/AcrR family transcriptional regulator [Firmicutes bacterium]|nr:TetR/AcrR family transcriptional regulator [Bacillota bacterium]